MKKNIIPLFAMALMLGFSSCIKDKMDSPPAGGVDPDLTPNTTIGAISSSFVGQDFQFNTDLILSAVVAADDSSGAYYHELALEDSTGGITILMDASNLYETYPVGRRLFIKLKGLWFTQKSGINEIGYAYPGGNPGALPSPFFANYIFPGKWGLAVAPKVVTISELNNINNPYLNELIELDNVEFAPGSAGVPYANGYTLASGTLYVQDCQGNSIQVYTSGYTDFANTLSPMGNGKLLAIYSVYGSSPQLTIRDLSDVAQMTNTNCNGAVNGSFSIASVRAKYTGSTVNLPAGVIITGTVISDVTNGNLSANEAVIQDATGGILIQFTSPNTLPLNALVTIDLAGGSLYRSNGWLQVNPVPNGNASQIGTGRITPQNISISKLNSNPGTYESTLVQISNVTFPGSSTYGGNLIITDGTGSASLYTLGTASFAGQVFRLLQKALPALLNKITAPNCR